MNEFETSTPSISSSDTNETHGQFQIATFLRSKKFFTNKPPWIPTLTDLIPLVQETLIIWHRLEKETKSTMKLIQLLYLVFLLVVVTPTLISAKKLGRGRERELKKGGKGKGKKTKVKKGSKKAKEEDPKEPYYVLEADDDGDGFGTLSSKMCCTYNGNCYDDSSYNWCNQSSRNCNNCNGVYMSIGGGGDEGPGCSCECYIFLFGVES